MIKIVSLELALKLKDAGFTQNTAFNFVDITKDREWGVVEIEYSLNSFFEKTDQRVAAPTAEEILESLPFGFILIKRHTGQYMCLEDPGREKLIRTDEIFKSYESAAEAAAKMWLYLKQQDLISVPVEKI
jgi:hypothetical protein